MDESCGKQYVDGLIEYIHKCDPDRWSKLEVDDFLEMLGLEVSKLEYFYLKPGMNLDEGLVRLFDNKSSMEMAELGVEAGIVDLYAVEANEVLVSQLTQDHTHTHMDGEQVFQEARDGDGVTATDNEDGDGVTATDSEDGDGGAVGADGGDNWDGGAVGADGGDNWDQGVVGADGGEYGDEDRAVGTDELEDGQVDKGKGKGNDKGKAKANAKTVGKSKAKAKPKAVGKGKSIDKVKSTEKGKGKLGAADKGKGKLGAAKINLTNVCRKYTQGRSASVVKNNKNVRCVINPVTIG